MKTEQILQSAYRTWVSGADLRRRRERHKNYTYGDQWCDPVHDGKGFMREDEHIIKSGKQPYSNNLIRQLVKTIVGRYRTICAESGAYAGGARAEFSRRNSLAELDSRLLEEFLISGCAVQKITDERRFGGTGVWVDNVDPRRFFVNPFRDPRGWDIELAGMLHDMSLAEVVSRYSHGDPARAASLIRTYDGVADGNGAFVADASVLGASVADCDDFYTAGVPGKCRVIEVWTFDSGGDLAGGHPEFRWHCRHFAPDGTVLDEYDSPYGHRSHPFAVKFYPLTDGEVHPFVEDVIDQQRYINRLIVTLDHIMSCSAKGVLLFPYDQRPKDVSWEQIGESWARADGIIPITGKGQTLPQQVRSGAADAGAYQLLNLQMRLFDQASGVGDALLGRNVSSNTGSELYDAQVRNATICLADLFDTFASFTAMRDHKAENCISDKNNCKNT